MTFQLNKGNLYLAQAKACLSNNDLVQASGLSRSGLLQVLKGQRNPRPETVGRLARALGVEVESLVMEDRQ